MNDKTISSHFVEQVINLLDLDMEDFRPNYSGRGMYGRECIAFDVPNTTYLIRLGAALSVAAADAAEDLDDVLVAADVSFALADRACVDSMGRGVVVYFPDWTLEDPE